MTKIVFEHLGMTVLTHEGQHWLSLCVASGHMEFEVALPLTDEDRAVIEADEERAAFLQAALHQPFQLKETRLGDLEQRLYLDTILHAPRKEVEAFLTQKDQGRANGAISNMLRLTCRRDCDSMRSGQWFKRQQPGTRNNDAMDA